MCTTARDIEDLSSFSETVQFAVDKKSLKKCKKCNAESILLLQKKEPFCKSCFFVYCKHKYCSAIGKSKKIKHGNKILFACSGGRKSAALLHMTQKALEPASFKQLIFSPTILYIDESFIFSHLNHNVNVKTSHVLQYLRSLKYPVLYTSLEMVYKVNSKENLYSFVTDMSDPETNISNQSLKTQLLENLENLTLSAKMDLLKHLKLLLATEIGKAAGFDALFVGDTASSLAVDLLSDIALGRGSQISFDTSFYDTRYKIPICRPLREILSKEIALYNHLYENEYFILPDFLTKTSNTSIQRLTEVFISNLQENFPATVFTIFRTGGKLSKSSSLTNCKACLLCKSNLDNLDPETCSALEALKISEKLSTNSSLEELSKLTVNSLSESNSLPFGTNTREFMKLLCHGCSITFKKMGKPGYFYELNSEVTCQKLDRNQMKEEIKDFLIDNSDI